MNDSIFELCPRCGQCRIAGIWPVDQICNDCEKEAQMTQDQPPKDPPKDKI